LTDILISALFGLTFASFSAEIEDTVADADAAQFNPMMSPMGAMGPTRRSPMNYPYMMSPMGPMGMGMNQMGMNQMMPYPQNMGQKNEFPVDYSELN
jgi:hypothetical protein